ncbi:oligosaccharide flippase family protein, partial [Planctomycetota bacterium]
MTAFVRVVGLGLVYLLTVALARLLGVEVYGDYAAAVSLAAILATVGAAGMPTLATRRLAQTTGRPQVVAVVRVIFAVTMLGIAIVLLSAAVSSVFLDRELPAHLVFAMLLFPVVSLIRVRQGIALPVLGATRAIAPEQIILPILLILAVWLLSLLTELHALLAITAHAVAGLVALTAGVWDLWKAGVLRVGGNAATEHVTPAVRSMIARTARVGLPFLFTELPRVLVGNIDIVIATAVLGSKAGGVYAIASRFANLIALPLLVVNLTYMPDFARLSKRAEQSELEVLARKAAGLSLLGGAAVFGALLLFHEGLLTLLGSGFSDVLPLLAILGVGQMTNSILGPNGAILQMTHNEVAVMKVVWLQALI